MNKALGALDSESPPKTVHSSYPRKRPAFALLHLSSSELFDVL